VAKDNTPTFDRRRRLMREDSAAMVARGGFEQQDMK
jgi:hypothetical protein